MGIPRSVKKQFKAKFDDYMKAMGKSIDVYLDPYEVGCPNCIFDSVQEVSANVYNEQFKRPVNIFPSTHAERIVYPVPFNVLTVSGVQYDPTIQNPKILKTTVCPVCKGTGILISANKICLTAVVTWGPKEEFLELSAGREGQPICRIKTFNCNYSVVRDATKFVVEGIECKLHRPPRVKGLGGDHIVEAYLLANEVGPSVSKNYDSDVRIDINNPERVSDQAPISTPTIPPTTPGDDIW